MKIKVFNSPLSCISKSIRFLLIVTNKNIILAITFIVFLNGCVQNTALLGPAYTFSSSGSVLQAGLSYGSNKAIKKISKNSKLESQKQKQLFDLLKANIEKTKKKLTNIN